MTALTVWLSSYSDDGAMTLALAQSFINPERAYDHVASIRNFLDWQFHGRFSTSTHAWDVGMSTRESLYIWKRCIPEHSVPGEVSTSDIQATQRKIDQALKFEKCSGNGSLMRISPVGLMLWREPEAAKQVAREQSRITHPATACMDACALYTELICRIMKGVQYR
jgi:ADP-ribosylglycohydrolase